MFSTCHFLNAGMASIYIFFYSHAEQKNNTGTALSFLTPPDSISHWSLSCENGSVMYNFGKIMCVTLADYIFSVDKCCWCVCWLRVPPESIILSFFFRVKVLFGSRQNLSGTTCLKNFFLLDVAAKNVISPDRMLLYYPSCSLRLI